MAAKSAPVDKRRLILDAAVRVFARQGFHTCRVSDIADEAGVAYGLVYHYFQSKDQVLDTLFLQRWDVLLEAIRDRLWLAASYQAQPGLGPMQLHGNLEVSFQGSSAPFAVHQEAMAGRKPGAGTMKPPSPCTGSISTAATFLAPTWVVMMSITRAAACAPVTPRSRYG